MFTLMPLPSLHPQLSRVPGIQQSLNKDLLNKQMHKSLLELWEGLEPIQLKDYYHEFFPYEGECRFAPCYHLSEPGCAVLEAMRNGELSSARVERYHLLLKKVQEAWRNRYD